MHESYDSGLGRCDTRVVPLYVCLYVCMYVYMCLGVYMCIYEELGILSSRLYTHTHTLTHSHTQASIPCSSRTGHFRAASRIPTRARFLTLNLKPQAQNKKTLIPKP
jgi:hypothetical protein